MKKNEQNSIYLFLLDITLDGGVERVVVNMANQFLDYYSHIYIVSNFQSNSSIKYPLNQNVKVHYLHKNLSLQDWKSKNIFTRLLNSGFIYSLFFSFGFTKKLYSFIKLTAKKNSKSIIMFHGYQTAWYRKRNIKSIGVDHSCFPFYHKDYSKILNRIKFNIVSFMNRKLDIVTILTDSELEYWRLLRRPVHIMPNFIPSVPDKLPNIKNREKIILSMGRMNTDQKGFDRLINAYSKIAIDFPDWKLNIFGSGKYKNEYQNMVEKLGISNYVKIKDFTDDPNVEYSKSSIYAMCSRIEGFGMVLIEAMSYGLPLVSYDVPYGPASIIGGQQVGYLIPDNDENLFCDKLKLLMSDSALIKEFSINAYIETKNKYTSIVVIPKWINLFNTLLFN